MGIGRDCIDLNPLPQPHLRERDCPIDIHLKVGEIIGLPGFGNADFSEMTVDLSASSVEISSTSGWTTISLTLNNGQTVANSFQWDRDGQLLKLANPVSVQVWFNQYVSVVDEATIVASDIRVTGDDGPNLYVAELYYDSTFLSGQSDSWYGSSSNCGGVFPDPQLCY